MTRTPLLRPVVAALATFAVSAGLLHAEPANAQVSTPALKVAPLACTLPGPANGSPTRGLWAWTGKIVSDPAERAKFLNFAQAQGVRTVYVSGTSMVALPAATVGTFVAEARQRCLQVELLFGAPEWGLTGNHAKPINLAQQAANLAAVLPPEQRPVGMHFDVEPYLLGQWHSDLNGTANQYLDLLEKLRPIAHGAGQRLSVDIPFWFDGKIVSRGGVARKLSELVADRTDRLVLMDYRDTVPAIVAGAEAEVAYAAQTGKDVTIGVETMCISPGFITFCEEGRAKMDAALTAVQQTFAGKPGYAGLAVHHYGSYLAMKP